MENDQDEIRRSSAERVKDTIDKARTLTKHAKRAKQAASVARTGAQLAVQGAEAAGQFVASAVSSITAGLGSTIEAWGPPVAIIVVALLIIIVGFTILLSVFNPQQTAGSNSCTGTCEASCPSGTTQDATASCPSSSTGSTASGTSQVCCIPSTQQNLDCNSNGGRCVDSGTPCPSPLKPDTTFTCTTSTQTCCMPPTTLPNLKFYCQYDSWNYGSCNIVSYGCFPSSLGMIMSSYPGGSGYTPSYVSSQNYDSLVGANIGCASNGTYDGTTNAGEQTAVSWAASKGYIVGYSQVAWGTSGTGINLTKLQAYLNNGYFILVGAIMPFRPTAWSSSNIVGGHSVVIYSVNPSAGTVTYFDPTWCVGGTSNSPIPQTVSISKFSEWYYAIPIKK